MFLVSSFLAGNGAGGKKMTKMRMGLVRFPDPLVEPCELGNLTRMGPFKIMSC